MSQNYSADFEISHGISHGFGIVYDANSLEKITITAENDLDALEKAEKQAHYFAKEFLANTTGYKTVEVTLKNSQGHKINQIETIKKEAEKSPKYNKENFDKALKILFPQGKLTVKRTWIDDLAEIEKHSKIL